MRSTVLMKCVQIFILVNLISFSQSAKTIFLTVKSMSVETSDKYVTKDTFVAERVPHHTDKVMGVNFRATIFNPIFEAHVKLTVWNKQFTPNFVKIFDLKQNMCAFLNGTEKNMFMEKLVSDVTATNKVLKPLIHPCPYKDELKFNMSIQLDRALKSFVKGEYKSEVTLWNKDEPNIITIRMVTEPVDIGG